MVATIENTDIMSSCCLLDFGGFNNIRRSLHSTVTHKLYMKEKIYFDSFSDRQIYIILLKKTNEQLNTF